MFDIAEIIVRGGDGGNGAVSFRREKGVPRGGPDGGNGGHGGAVFLVGRTSVTSLKALHLRKRFEAERGENGRAKDQFGKGGEDLEIEVPTGTEIFRLDASEAAKHLGEVLEEGQLVRVARGGRGGRGNAMFTSATQQAPYIAEKGEAGQEIHCRMELRLIADVGIIGKPNAGKSTLLSAASAAHPKIAAYPFTTTEPQLGVVDVGWRTFILAEIPGLIEGAHMGIGLGHEFLRHATRTRLLIHLVDGSSEDVPQDVKDVDAELAAYGWGLDEKPQHLVVNKLDMPEVTGAQRSLQKRLAREERPVSFISAAASTGVRELMETVARTLNELPVPAPKEQEEQSATVLPGRRLRNVQPVLKEGDTFVVLHDEAVRLVGGSNLGVWAARAQLKGRLDRMGITKALEEAGIQPGNTVRFGDAEIEW